MRRRAGFAILLALALAGCDETKAAGDAPDVVEVSDVAGDTAPDGVDTGDVPGEAADVAAEAADAAEVVLPPGCCRTDEDCDKGTDQAFTCAFRAYAEAGEWGACKVVPDAGLCWDDGDCPDGQGCNGPSFCPCDQPCGAPEARGTCKPFAGPGENCGSEGAKCRPDLACCYPCGIPDCDWECTEPCDESEPACANGCWMYP